MDTIGNLSLFNKGFKFVKISFLIFVYSNIAQGVFGVLFDNNYFVECFLKNDNIVK